MICSVMLVGLHHYPVFNIRILKICPDCKQPIDHEMERSVEACGKHWHIGVSTRIFNYTNIPFINF